MYAVADWSNLRPDLGRRLAKATQDGLRVWGARLSVALGDTAAVYVQAHDEYEARQIVGKIPQAWRSQSYGSWRNVLLRELSVEDIHNRFGPNEPRVIHRDIEGVPF